jgi:hypothetical protein
MGVAAANELQDRRCGRKEGRNARGQRNVKRLEAMGS